MLTNKPEFMQKSHEIPQRESKRLGRGERVTKSEIKKIPQME